MEGVTVLDAKGAIARHVQWRITLQCAITFQEPLSPEALEQIRRHRSCAIGRWLESPATAEMRTTSPYYDLVARHLEFHHQMGCIAKLIADRQFIEALAAIQPGSAFDKSSNDFALAITAYDAVSRMAVAV